MKRLVIVAIMAAFLLGTVGAAQAAKLEISDGDFRVHANYVKNPNFDSDQDDDKFEVLQRFRTSFNFVASENVRAVVQLQFNMGERWGGAVGDNGYRLGGDQDVRLRQSYLQFNVPNTQVEVKAGWQAYALPNTLGSHIIDSRVPALVVSAPINDMLGVTAGYARTDDAFKTVFDVTRGDFVSSKDEVDHFFLIAPVTLDGASVNPFVHYARVGKYTGAAVGTGVNNLFSGDEIGLMTSTGNERSQNIWFAGINATIDMFDPIVIMGDINYGQAGRTNSVNRAGQQSGWIADLAVQYKMDMFTPMIFALYETGESRTSGGNARKGKVMPTLAPDLTLSSFGFNNSQFADGGNAAQALSVIQGPTGKWGVGLRLSDITYMDKLSHEFQIAYYQGTNHNDSGQVFLKEDKAWEVNFDSQYQVYENLAAIVELGYIKLDLDRVSTDDAWKAAAGVRYRF